METWAGFCTRSIIDNIVFHFTGDTHKNSSVIKVNSENLLANGELYFLCNFKAWRDLLTCSKGCTSILQHFAHAHGATKGNTDADVAEKIFKQLILKSSSWLIRIQRCTLQKERICLFLNRGDIVANSIRMAIECGMTFGKAKSTDKAFILKYQPDGQSDLTTQRLLLMRNIAAKALSLHGHMLSTGANCVGRYMFTSKSEGSIDEGYKKYVCGVVKNSQTNSKEICLTWEQYIRYKMNQLAELSEHKFIEDEKNDAKDLFLRNLANAIIIFELTAVKPSRSVIIRNNNFEDDRSITNTRGASFALYNAARIATIITKHNEKVSCGDYPSLPDIKNVDFSQLQEEEEWELIYNFILGYPQMINDCLKCEPSFHVYPQVICLFLSRLCQKFSVYYRKVRILTEGGNHLIPKMVARLYMLRALHVVFENALDILGIKPVSRM
ncbi:DALR anticodon-binding domain-containing protein 3 [Trachymyrmex zeteki]|uniref:DALR anticodon-binding domain-containing protein 3 n=1 Tax=Mycetomoellerius zeteki TaxID=64791 RepID=A0A151WEY7_9HYME|nr:PREDICTED: DALR anticodon-binding domain-containing protein 3 [Trachymyrmex zeteki]KYQ46382.1 DALR anticodon-binding domain-containing protein 3 [Trachymyrmex zeteki]